MPLKLGTYSSVSLQAHINSKLCCVVSWDKHSPGAHFIELVINEQFVIQWQIKVTFLILNGLKALLHMVVVSEWQVFIDDKFYEMGPGSETP